MFFTSDEHFMKFGHYIRWRSRCWLQNKRVYSTIQYSFNKSWQNTTI